MTDSALEPDEIHCEDADHWGGDHHLTELDYTNESIRGNIPLSRVSADHNPFENPPWHDGQGVSMAGVRKAINEGRVRTTPYPASILATDWTDRMHEERIAWLVLNSWSDPIEIEFSYPECESFSIDDGNHRLSAAIFRGDEDIYVQLGGYVDNSVRALGAICRPIQRLAHVTRSNTIAGVLSASR
jgi:hypothetical protein